MLALAADRVDLSGKVIVFESLKKPQRGLYRAAPVPAAVSLMPSTSYTTSESRSAPGKGRLDRVVPGGASI